MEFIQARTGDLLFGDVLIVFVALVLLLAPRSPFVGDPGPPFPFIMHRLQLRVSVALVV